MVIVPTGSEHADFEEDVDLGGTVFRVRVQYNGRDDSWYLSVSDVDENPLVMGVRLTLDTSTLGPHVGEDLPQGALAVIDPAETRQDPSRQSLDDEVMALVFFTLAELAE